MKRVLDIAWERFSLNSSIVADLNGRFISTLFYWTILTPFGLLSSIFMDPLRMKPAKATWLPREPLPTDLDSAREQG